MTQPTAAPTTRRVKKRKYVCFSNEKGDYTIAYKPNNPDGETMIASTDTAEKADFIAKACNYYDAITDEKRPLHTMTPAEFRKWTNAVKGNMSDEACKAEIKQVCKSLFTFYNFLSKYGNFDSLVWLVAHNFDISFHDARLNANQPL